MSIVIIIENYDNKTQFLLIFKFLDLIELIDKKDLSEGWLLKRPIDVSDYEWIAIRETFVKNFKWIAIYLMLTQIIAKYRPKVDI